MSLLKFSKDSTLLVEKSLPKHPITLFNDWLDHAKKNLPSYQLPTAMCLSTFNENNVSNRYFPYKCNEVILNWTCYCRVGNIQL